MWSTFPLFGSTLLLCVMVVASYTFAVSVAAGATGRLRTLQAARFGAYGTVTLIGATVLCLAYAFVSHDFRLRYVAHYSDRSMPLGYLLTALWGGQDGSLLWWLFLLSIYIGLCVRWLGKRYLELQPYVIAALMGVVLFFCVLMAFAANPFSTGIAGALPDGEGLNPLLQNFYMIIHPPSLYTGFVGCTIPFAFCVAALVTGRLDHEWIVASRRWMLFAWMFLAIGNTLGMLWAYEELGWGGYWAWDPVENAAFMPFISATAYVHSVMIQERRGMLKVWNVWLICVTFFLTIFGTFLTRSGAIASVHSFAQSSIGEYFVWFLVALFCVALSLILYRWPELRDLSTKLTPNDAAMKRVRKAALVTGWSMLAICGPGLWGLWHLQLDARIRATLIVVTASVAVFLGLEVVYRRMVMGLGLRSQRPTFESVFSREFTFLLNNWILMGMLGFVLVATTFPMITEALANEKVSVGPPYYAAWMQPLGLLMFFLMGVGPLFGWKKSSPEALRRALILPTAAFVVAVALHVALGAKLGFPAVVWGDAIYPGALGSALRAFNAFTPVLGFSLAVFNAVVIGQEYAMLFRARARSGAGKDVPRILWWLGGLPGLLYTLITLPPASRRRYGGYIVHLGIVLMFLGFAGKSWNVDKETTLIPGQTFETQGYSLHYVGPRMEVDNAKRMVFADIRVSKNGKEVGQLAPAKFIYKKMPESPTTEVSMLHSVRDDLYLVIGMINPQTKQASLQVHVNPLVSWIWFGCVVLICGSIVCMWPQLEPSESRVWAFARGGAAVVASVTLGIGLSILPAPAMAQGQGVSSLHSGTVRIENDQERALFSSLRCMCGTCARELLSTCGCNVAEDARTDLRAQLAAGKSRQQIMDDYVREYGPEALAVPPNTGALKAIWALPAAAVCAGGIGLFFMMRRFRKGGGDGGPKGAGPDAGSKTPRTRDEYDARLDEELKDLDD